MWTQRDQLQAYQFLRRRLVSALQSGDANHPQSPSRRLIVGCALGVVGVLLIGAGSAVLGMFGAGAGQDWRKPGQVVIEKETGAPFVLGADGLLHPVLNYASARLLAGAAENASVSVSARSLAGVPRGLPLGIAGAPTSLPPAGSLLSGAWTVCSEAPADRPTATAPTTVAMVGVPPTGNALGAGDLLVVRDGTGIRYVVTAGRRLRVRDPGALVAIGADAATAANVSQAWINALPAGPDLAFIAVAGKGRAGVRVGEVPTRVGQVLVATSVGAGDRYYVVRADGLAPVTQIEAALILGNPANKAAYRGTPQAIRVSAADVGVAPASATASPGGYPAVVPRPVTADQVMCVVTGAAGQVGVRLAATVPLPGGAHPVPVAGTGQAAAPMADEIYVPPGSGALVRDQPAPGVEAGTLYLITDQGVRYPLGGADAAKALGYGAARPVPLASTVLALFPRGPLLDVRSAQQVVAAQAQ
jgi:type VII secretion protein EccB